MVVVVVGKTDLPLLQLRERETRMTGVIVTIGATEPIRCAIASANKVDIGRPLRAGLLPKVAAEVPGQGVVLASLRAHAPSATVARGMGTSLRSALRDEEPR